MQTASTSDSKIEDIETKALLLETICPWINITLTNKHTECSINMKENWNNALITDDD